MNWTISQSASSELFRINAAGHATAPECERLVNELIGLAGWHQGSGLLIDCRNVNVKHLRFDEVDRSSMIVQRKSRALGPCKIAIIATAGVGFGVGKQFKFVTEAKTEIRVDVFLNEDEALNWLAG